MGKRLIQDESEVRRWIEEGRPYTWMVEQYQEKYGIPVSVSMFTNYRARHGLARRDVRNTDLIPWEVKREHRWQHPLGMLRAEARVRAGEPLAGRINQKHASFMAKLKAEDLVVAYDDVEGFKLVPRDARDRDIIREPPHHQRTRRHPWD